MYALVVDNFNLNQALSMGWKCSNNGDVFVSIPRYIGSSMNCAIPIFILASAVLTADIALLKLHLEHYNQFVPTHPSALESARQALCHQPHPA